MAIRRTVVEIFRFGPQWFRMISSTKLLPAEFTDSTFYRMLSSSTCTLLCHAMIMSVCLFCVHVHAILSV